MLKTAQKTVKFLIVVFNCLGWLSWRLYNLWTSNTLCCTGESFCLLALDTTHCCCSVTQLYLTLFDPCTAACQASLSFTISQSFLNSCPLSRWCHPTILSSVIPFSSCPQSPSIRFFSKELTLCIRWPKYWSFSFSISPSDEYSGLISFRIGLISLLSKGLSRVFSNTTVRKHQFSCTQPLYCPALTSIHDYQRNRSFD